MNSRLSPVTVTDVLANGSIETEIGPSASVLSPTIVSPRARHRNSRACDQCRKLRTKCVRTSHLRPCSNCTRRSLVCTAEGPENKRGPPRGYLHALEERLQGAEALLGVLMSLPDSHVGRILQSMQHDPKASDILSKVEHSAFGPSGRKMRAWLIDAVNSAGPQAEFKRHTRLGLANDTANPLVTQRTNDWQDALIQLITSRMTSTPCPPSLQPGHTAPVSIYTPSPVSPWSTAEATLHVLDAAERHNSSEFYQGSRSYSDEQIVTHSDY